MPQPLAALSFDERFAARHGRFPCVPVEIIDGPHRIVSSSCERETVPGLL